MLGKLIKNEFKISANSILNIYLAAAITIVIMLLSYFTKITWISTLSTVALLAISGIAVLITLVAVVSNFYKTLYGAQGYLSFTLPVKSGQLLASKAIVSFAWILLSYIMAVAIWVGVYFYAAAKIGQDRITTIKTLLQLFEGVPGEKAIKQLLIFACVLVFAQIAVFIAEIYFAITLANTKTFQKMGMVSAIFIFFAIFIVMQIIIGILTSYVPIALTVGVDGLMLSFEQSMVNYTGGISIGVTGFIFQIIAATGLFAGTAYLMKNKVNIK
ncbi:MAG: hypothetical protein GXZ02_01375 [Clostridiales bacterium]|nr:hypothetical protein [Clostridiales bacterium]